MQAKAMIIAVLLCLPAPACNAKSRGKGTVIDNAGDLPGYAGQKVTAVGRKSDLPWQHLIDPPETHADIVYFDMGEIQIVVYADEIIDCGGDLTVTGTVVELEGTSKRPGSKEIHTEYHIVVDKWECGDNDSVSRYPVVESHGSLPVPSTGRDGAEGGFFSSARRASHHRSGA